MTNMLFQFLGGILFLWSSHFHPLYLLVQPLQALSQFLRERERERFLLLLFLAKVYLAGELFSQKETDMESYNAVIVSAVEHTIKKYAEKILRVLEGMSGRLSQLESLTQGLEQSVESLKTSVDEYHSEGDARIRRLNNHVMEMYRAVQILRDKQEIIETHTELEKLRSSKLETAFEKPGVSSSGTSSLQPSEHIQNQQLSLAVVPAVVPSSQLQLPAKEVIPTTEATLHMQHLSLSQSTIPTQLHYVAVQGNSSHQAEAHQVQQQLQMQPTMQQVPQQQLQVQPITQVHQQLLVQQGPQLHLQPQAEMHQSQMQVLQLRQGGLHHPAQGEQSLSQQGPTILPQPIPQQTILQFQEQIPVQNFQEQFQIQQQVSGLQSSQIQPQRQQSLQQQPQGLHTSHQPQAAVTLSAPQQSPQALLMTSQPIHPQGQAVLMSVPSALPSLPPIQPAFPHLAYQNESQYASLVSPEIFAPSSLSQGYMAGSLTMQQQLPTHSPHHIESSLQRSVMGGPAGLQPSYVSGVSGSAAWRDQEARALPVAHAVNSGSSENRSRAEVVIDRVVAMGFPRDQVSSVIRRLTEKGQAVDMNLVIDTLMNNRDSQPQRGWQR